MGGLAAGVKVCQPAYPARQLSATIMPSLLAHDAPKTTAWGLFDMPIGLFAALGRFVASPAFKLALIGFLVLLLGIPLVSVWALVSERESRSNDVATEVARSWGGQQAVTGPFLMVPYTVKVQVVSGDKQIEETQKRLAIFLPDTAAFSARTTSQVLHRSIYQVPVYVAEMAVSGRFEAPDISKVETGAAAVQWDEASLALGLSDVSGLKQASPMTIAGRGEAGFEPSLGAVNAQMNGIHARLADVRGVAAPAGPLAAFDYSFKLNFSGSYGLSFAPVGRETTASLVSDWPNPSFSGAFLPTERKIGAGGFTASWKVPHLARSIPQAWSSGEGESTLLKLAGFQFGANLFVPVAFYDLVTRALKYGLMFPVVGFMGVFIMETLARRPMHPVQYAFSGVALVLFFVLLLSFAEHIGFLAAYIVAAFATSLLVAAYVWRAMGSLAKGCIMLGVLLILYALLYLILRLEDYALLAGALAGFALLAAAMFLTLGIDWSGGNESAEGKTAIGTATLETS